MKLADVLMTLTLVVLEARVRARVKRPHMIPLKTRFKTKKSWWVKSELGVAGMGVDV